MNTESETLARAFDEARALTRFYTSKLKGFDPAQVFEVDGKKLNTLYWLNAHLVWAENFLVLQGCGGTPFTYDWLESFGFGTNPEEAKGPSFEEILIAQKEVHEKVLEHIRLLDNDGLSAPNKFKWQICGGDQVRNILYHNIRHEATHAGHIGWLCKLHGIETI